MSENSEKNPLLCRIPLFIESGEFQSAQEYCDKLLEQEPENGWAYFYRAMAELKFSDEKQLIKVDWDNNASLKFAKRFADDELKAKIDQLLAEQAEYLRKLREEAAVQSQVSTVPAVNVNNPQFSSPKKSSTGIIIAVVIISIVAVIGTAVGGIYAAYRYFNPPPAVGGKSADRDFNPPPDTSYQTYGKAVAKKIGEEVKKVSPSKAVWITADGSSEYAKECIKVFKKTAGCEVEVVALMDGEGGMIDVNESKLNEILKGCAATEAVVLDASFMGDAKKVEFLRGGYKGPKVFITQNGYLMGVTSKQFKTALNRGYIVAAVASLSDVDSEFKPSDRDLEEAFAKRYVIVNKDNFEEYKENMGFMK